MLNVTKSSANDRWGEERLGVRFTVVSVDASLLCRLGESSPKAR